MVGCIKRRKLWKIVRMYNKIRLQKKTLNRFIWAIKIIRYRFN